MASSDIDKAFTQALLAAGLGLDLVFENGFYSVWGGASYSGKKGTYVPQAERAYAEAFLIENDITPRSLNDSDETDGLFRVVLRYPTQVGAVAAKEKADVVLAAFKIGASICYSGQCATVVGQRREAGVAEEGWFKVVVTIRYRSFLGR